MGAEITSYDTELQRSGRLAAANVGRSMLPLLREGRDVMVVERCDPWSLAVGDAVLFRRPGIQGRGAYVLHRILRRLPDGCCWTAGDNCTAGETVRPEQILGRLTAVVRDGKTIRVTDFRYRLYVLVWCRPWRLRFALLRALRLFRRCLRGG